MIEVCLANSDLSGAASVFRQVKPSLEGYIRAAQLFAIVVKACVQNKRTRLAMDLYEDIKGTFQCSKVAYNTLIDALVRTDDLGRAAAVFRDMSTRGVDPDVVTYSTLIKGHCSRGDLDQALLLLGQMQRRGIVPDAILFNSILDGCAHQKMRSLTEQVLRDMETAGVAPSNFTVSTLVKLYGRCGDLDAAFHVFNTYPAAFGFQVNAQVCTCLMSACIANGELSKALGVYDTMRAAGCTSDAKTYKTLLSGCLRYRDLTGAVRLINEALANPADLSQVSMLDRGTTDGILLMAVRKGHVADIALPMLGQLRGAGIIVSERVCTAVEGRDDRQLRRRMYDVSES